MRRVLQALEHVGRPWYITGSEALAAYASPRQTLDVDVVADLGADQLEALAERLRDHFYFAKPITIGNRRLAAFIDNTGAGKVDLIVREADPWALEAMSRRERWEHPEWGPVWVSSLEDLVLAKLEWSEGTSELQLRDCATLLRLNRGRLDRAYLDAWAERLGVSSLLRRVLEVSGAS